MAEVEAANWRLVLSRVPSNAVVSHLASVFDRKRETILPKSEWTAQREKAARDLCVATGLDSSGFTIARVSKLFLPTDFVGTKQKPWATVTPFLARGVEKAKLLCPSLSRGDSKVLATAAGLELARLLRFNSFAVGLRGARLNWLNHPARAFFPELTPVRVSGTKHRYSETPFELVISKEDGLPVSLKARREPFDGFNNLIKAIALERRRMAFLATAIHNAPVGLKASSLRRDDALYWSAKEVEFLAGAFTGSFSLSFRRQSRVPRRR